MKNSDTFVNVVTAGTESISRLLKEDYLLVGVFTEDMENVHPIKGLALTKSMATHQQAKDYLASTILVKGALNRIGIDSLMDTVVGLCKKHQKQKVAFISHGSEWSFRHIFASWMLSKEFDIIEYGMSEPEFITHMGEAQQRMRIDTYKNTGVEAMTDAELAEVLEQHDWRFAKTMPTNPHWYTIRKTWRKGLFEKVYLNIREKGKIEIFYGKVYRVFYADNGWKYWTMPCGFHEGTQIADNIVLINKARITNGI